MTDEREVWAGRPSQVVNLGTYILCFLFCWLVVPLVIALVRWLDVRNTKYSLTTERIRLETGILNKKINDLELYRVKDYVLDRPFFLRLFSLSNLHLETSDKTHPNVVIRAIRNGDEIREQLRTYVEACRTRKRVREVDFE